ncbi:MAG: pantoate--beta-alanine ligase [Gammaproteobacteria bacterium]
MQIIPSLAEMRALVAALRRDHERIAFVPTMGNLHAGHLSLVHKARALADRVVVSIYVNPLQFGAGEDFAHYPRTLAEDCALLETAGVDGVFTPTDAALYPEGKDNISHVVVPQLDSILEGAQRPGHFRGVATIVNKLFNIVQPDLALFGEKDFQQLLLIRRMVEDLNLPVEILGLPTVREASGLAMSSRNAYLSAAEKAQAAELFHTLRQLREHYHAGDTDLARLSAEACARLREQGFLPEYVEIRRSHDLQRPQGGETDLVILAAARLGGTRLIDNLRI